MALIFNLGSSCLLEQDHRQKNAKYHNNGYSQCNSTHNLTVTLQELHPLVVAVSLPDVLHHCLVVDDTVHVCLAAGSWNSDFLQARSRIHCCVVFPHLPGL